LTEAVLRIVLRVLIKLLFSSEVPMSAQRLGFKLAGSRLSYPRGTEIVEMEMNGVPALPCRASTLDTGARRAQRSGGASVGKL
jgi:hypothetical protein